MASEEKKIRLRKTTTATLSRDEVAVIQEVMGDGDAIIEEALAGGGSGLDGEEIDQYVLTCLESIDKKQVDAEALNDVTTFDRMYLLKRIRLLSLGPIVNVPWICTKGPTKKPCNTENESPVNIETLAERKPDYEAKTFTDKEFGEVILNLSTGRTEATMTAAANMDRLMVRVHRVGDGPFLGAKSYPSSFLKKIREKRNLLDGDPGMTELCVCSKCGKMTRLAVICRDFFGV